MVKIIGLIFLGVLTGWIVKMWWNINKWIFLGMLVMLFLIILQGL
jgi:hypothetical protein